MKKLTVYIDNGTTTAVNEWNDESYDFSWRLGDKFLGVLTEDKDAGVTKTRLIPVDDIREIRATVDKVEDDGDAKFLAKLREKAETEKDPKKFVTIANAALDFADHLINKDKVSLDNMEL